MTNSTYTNPGSEIPAPLINAMAMAIWKERMKFATRPRPKEPVHIDRCLTEAVLSRVWPVIEKLARAVNETNAAYCGIGDFEGTGANMAAIMPGVRQAVAAYLELTGEKA